MDRKLPEFLRPADVSLLPAQVHELTPEEQRERYFERWEERVEQEPISQILGDLEGGTQRPPSCNCRKNSPPNVRRGNEDGRRDAQAGDGSTSDKVGAMLRRWS